MQSHAEETPRENISKPDFQQINKLKKGMTLTASTHLKNNSTGQILKVAQILRL